MNIYKSMQGTTNKLKMVLFETDYIVQNKLPF